MTRSILCILLLFCINISLHSQSADSEISMESFNADLMNELLQNRIDQYRLANGADVLIDNEILSTAAMEQAEDNKDDQRVDSQDDIGKRVEKKGGTRNAVFMAGYVSAGRSKDMSTYSEVVDEVIEKFSRSKRNKETLTSPEFFYSGIGISADVAKRRIYVSLVMGKINALNLGADKALRNSLPIKYGTKKMGLAIGDDKLCRGAAKFENYRKLYKGLTLIDNMVYLEYDNLKELSRLLRKSKDGLAIDFIQLAQYPCGGPNIMNNTLPSKGIMTKPMYSKKLFKKNEVEGKRVRSFYGPVAKVSKKVVYNLPEEYEMNLVVVQSKAKCMEIKRGYIEMGGQESLTKLDLYPDTAINDVLGTWEIDADEAELTFVVPFEQGKSNYKPQDIQPILDTLNEPKYVVNEIFISAFSSLEGTQEINERLQMARAESMIRAIEQIQGTSNNLLNKENIHTADGWEIFQDQITGDENYAYFVGMDKAQVLEEMRSNREVYKKLEPLFEKQRFAKVTMKISYDVTGEFEEPFVISRLLKAIKKNDGAEALKIQKFAMRKIDADKYSADNLIQMEIPDEEQFASIKVNKLYLDTRKNYGGAIDPELTAKFKGVFDLAPQNDFAAYNYYLTAIKNARIKNIAQLNDLQSGVQELYSSRIPKKLVDGINLELQFRTMEYVDSLDSEEFDKVKETSLDRIKKIYKIEGSSWQNALKLAYIFIESGDINYALGIMTPFIGKSGLSEEFYFTYITASAEDQENIFKREFKLALEQAKEMNKERYCELFGEPYLTFQLLDHPIIKKEYCSTCD
ncbi:MAG: hypothetical protein HKN92_03795 [Chitinophagales bacterium]|nr:hypothetical protein [Chitinophagales bacterium]